MSQLVDIAKQMNLDYQKYNLKQQKVEADIYSSIKSSGVFDFLDKVENVEKEEKTNLVARPPDSKDLLVLFKPEPEIRTTDEIFQLNEKEKLVQVVADLTETNNISEISEYTVSQIGDYQIWRDSDEIAIVDTESNRLIAYGELNQDFFVKPTSHSKLPDSNNQDRLLNKVEKFHPNLDLAENKDSIDKAHKFIAPLDPNLRASQIQNNEWKINPREIGSKIFENSRNILNKVKEYSKKIPNKLYQSYQENIESIEQRSKLIASQIQAKRLIKESLKKFENAYSKTEESSYKIGNYKIVKDNKSDFKIYDKNDSLIVGFQKQFDKATNKEIPTICSHSKDLVAINKALKEVKDERNIAIGNKKLENDYKTQVFGISNRLNQYNNGSYNLGQSNFKLTKENSKILLSDGQDKKLLEINGKGIKTDISAQQIKDVSQSIQYDVIEKEQDIIVAKSAKIVGDYLNLNKETTIEKNKFKASYNSRNRSLKYLDKEDNSNSFEAKYNNGKWQRVNGRVSAEKAKEFENVAQKIKQFKESQVKQQKKAAARRL